VTFTDGTATGGTCAGGGDYANVPATVNFADGDATPQTVNVTICDDATSEADESFGASLGNFTGGATGGSLSSTTVTITNDDFTISGQIAYGTPNTSSSIFVPGVLLNAAGTPSDSATSDTSGNYMLTGLGFGPYTVTPSKSGDVNGINSQDASQVARFAAGLITLTANQQIAADASNDGTINSFDASRIARFAAGLSNTGVTGQWKFLPASRSYASLSGNLSGENYDAILVGDVNGTWLPPGSFGMRESDPEIIDGNERSFDSSTAELLRQNYPEIDISVFLQEDVAGKVGSTIAVPVIVGDTTGKGIGSYDFRVSFDPAVLRVASVEKADTLSERFTVTSNVNIPGQVIVSGFGAEDLIGTGTLIWLRFDIVGEAGMSANLKWESFIFNETVPVLISGKTGLPLSK
jgi:hypothetical protein